MAAPAPAHANVLPLLLIDDDPNFATVMNPVAGEYEIALVQVLPGEEVNPGLTVQQIYDAEIDALCSTYGATCLDKYLYLGGLHASMTETEARAMSHDTGVVLVEEESPMVACTYRDLREDLGSGLVRIDDKYGVDRIDQRGTARDDKFKYLTNGRGYGVNLYILDSGVETTNAQFEGRATNDHNVLTGGVNSDVNNHGTAVASIAGGSRSGVADLVSIHAIKIADAPLNQGPSNYAYQTNLGLDWIMGHYDSDQPTVICLPYTYGGNSQAVSVMRVWVEEFYAAGVLTVTSAGNYETGNSSDSHHADDFVPANVPSAITVGAIDASDHRADNEPSGSKYFSSRYGPAVDIFAPGVGVQCAAIGANGGGVTEFGITSASAPFVAGVAAQYLSVNPTASPADVTTWILANASNSNGTRYNIPGEDHPSQTTKKILYTNPTLTW